MEAPDVIVVDHLPSELGRAALTRYRYQPIAVRAHVTVRALSCPIDAVLRHLPDRGRVLDVGCGHGLLSVAAALGGPDRTVCGVDVDVDKISHARAVAAGLDGRVSFEATAPGELPRGPWDAIMILDVLYLLDEPTQRALLQQCVERLAPGGVLLVKEIARTPRWKYRVSELQELLAVKVVHITEGSEVSFLPPEVLVGWLQDTGLVVSEERLDAGRVHPHHLVVGRRPV